MQTIQEFTENILVPNNDIDVKIKTYNDDIVEFNEKMTDLSERMDNQRALYTEQFTAMESSVASFKKTGDLLTNFMDSWRASLQGQIPLLLCFIRLMPALIRQATVYPKRLWILLQYRVKTANHRK